MDREEFNEWLNRYCKRYSGVANLIAGDPTISNDWFGKLNHCTIVQLTEAMQTIMASDPQPFPQEHLGKLLSIIRRMKFAEPKPIDHNWGRIESYKCLTCFDRGTVEVYQEKAYRPIQDGSFVVSRHLNSWLVRCYCSAGEKHRLPMFDANEHCQVKAVKVSDQVDELVEFINDRWKPKARYEWAG